MALLPQAWREVHRRIEFDGSVCITETDGSGYYRERIGHANHWPSTYGQALGQLGQLGGGLASAGAIMSYDPVPAKKKPPIDTEKLDALKKAEPRKVLRQAPDMVTPIVGWRCWRVDSRKLKAVGTSHIWEPKKALQAKCSGVLSVGQSHEAPSESCQCGVWAFKDMDLLLKAILGYDDLPVIGQVSLWGRVIETENGFRAAFAYPKELWLFDSKHEYLGWEYGVPVRTA